MQSATDNYVLKSTKKNAIDAACSGVDSRTSQSQFAKSNIKSWSILIIYIPSRWAVFLPIPGKLDKE